MCRVEVVAAEESSTDTSHMQKAQHDHQLHPDCHRPALLRWHDGWKTACGAPAAACTSSVGLGRLVLCLLLSSRTNAYYRGRFTHAQCTPPPRASQHYQQLINTDTLFFWLLLSTCCFHSYVLRVYIHGKAFIR